MSLSTRAIFSTAAIYAMELVGFSVLCSCIPFVSEWPKGGSDGLRPDSADGYQILHNAGDTRPGELLLVVRPTELVLRSRLLLARQRIRHLGSNFRTMNVAVTMSLLSLCALALMTPASALR